MTTMNELFDRYERECLPKLSPRTQKDYTAIIKRLRATFGHRDCLKIKPRDIGNFLDVDEGKVSANRHVSVLSAVFSKAVGRWYVHDNLRNPCVGVERNETKRRTRYITDAEYEALRGWTPECLQVLAPSLKQRHSRGWVLPPRVLAGRMSNENLCNFWSSACASR